MNPLVSKRSWLLAPALCAAWAALLVCVWAALEPATLMANFDGDGRSPVELMTLPLFALVVPLVWLCPPASGAPRRQALWSAVWSALGVIAIIRETDLHKLLVARIWPDLEFHGTVFKMRFLTSAEVPLAPKLFVLAFFVLFFAAALLPLVRYVRPLVKGFFRFEPVAWTMAFFGGVTAVVLVADRLPSKLDKAGVALSDSAAALLKAFEEGGEMLMALLALLAVLQSHLLFGRGGEER